MCMIMMIIYLILMQTILCHFYSNFDELLKTINWPMTKETSAKSLQLWQQRRTLFAAIFRDLVAIDPAKRGGSQEIPTIDDPIPLPIDLMLSPLRKRFKYHFCGSRQTNSKEKVRGREREETERERVVEIIFFSQSGFSLKPQHG